MSYQSQLDKLMQMATIEQLKDLMRQFNNNVSEKEKETSFSNQEILSLPIVQKVVFAYEEELKAVKNRLYQGDSQCSCHNNNTELLNRLDEQHKLFTDMFFKMEDKMNELSNDIHKLNIILNVSNQSSHFITREPVISEHDFVEHVIESIVADDHAVAEHVVVDEQVAAADEQVDVAVEQVNIKLEIQEIVDNNLNQHSDEHEYIIVENNFDILEDDESVISEEAEETVISEEAESDEDETEEAEEAVEEGEEADEVVEAVEEGDEVVEAVEADELDEADDDVVDEAVEEAEEVEEDDVVEETDEEVATDDAEDEEVFEIEIDDVTYFATDEENGILYEVTKTGEVGKKVGIIKDGEPIFS